MPSKARLILFVGVLTCAFNLPAKAEEQKELFGHTPGENREATRIKAVDAHQTFHLAIGLQPRNTNELSQLMQDVSDPSSPRFRQFITQEDYLARFSPSQADYDQLIQYVVSNHLSYTTSPNRLILDVDGTADNVQVALHTTISQFKHPTKGSYFAPDHNPTLPVRLNVVDIQGLTDLNRPHPHLHHIDHATTKGGSGGYGSYMGDDFRTAYVPGTTLTGAGQSVGLMEFDGFYPADIAYYAHLTGGTRTNIAINVISVDGYGGAVSSTNGEQEVSLDIEMTMAIAPGLTQIAVFEGGPSGTANDILTAMLNAASTVKSLSSSWGWIGGPSTTTDNIYQAMAVQGQSFFNAAGDNCAFTTGNTSVNGVDNPSLQNAPSSSPYITQVGGTKLYMNGTAASYASEAVWNWGTEYGSSYDGVGSSGGISSYYGLPYWQTNITTLTARGGSTTHRNIPDVALTAEDIYLISDGNQTATPGFGGTSAAAPLWAGFIALVNQELAQAGSTSAGFINPFIYSLARQSRYTNCFNDTTTGNNTWSYSSSLFYAATNYDLCTGLGTPKVALISAFMPIYTNFTLSASSVSGIGYASNAITWSSITISNSGNTNLTWVLTNLPTWLTVNSTNGNLAVGGTTNLTFRSTGATSNLFSGNYTSSILLTNRSQSTNILVSLSIVNPLILSPTNGIYAVGPTGGPITYYSTTVTVTNAGNSSLKWGIQNSTNWLKISPTTGTNSPGSSTTLTLNVTTNANSYPIGVFNFTIIITNAFGTVTLPNSLIVAPALTFSSISASNQIINLHWQGSTYANYAVYYNTDLTTTNWALLIGPFTPSSTNINVQDTNTSFPRKFYRLEILP